MKGKYVVLDRHLVEEHGKDTLLHLTSILGTKDYHFLFGEVDGDGGARGHALRIPIRRERSSIVDGVIRMEVFKVLSLRADQHVAHEQCVIRTCAHYSHPDAVLLVPTGEAINDIDAVSSVEEVNSSLAVDAPDLIGVLVTMASKIPRKRIGQREHGKRGASEEGRGTKQANSMKQRR